MDWIEDDDVDEELVVLFVTLNSGIPLKLKLTLKGFMSCTATSWSWLRNWPKGWPSSRPVDRVAMTSPCASFSFLLWRGFCKICSKIGSSVALKSRIKMPRQSSFTCCGCHRRIQRQHFLPHPQQCISEISVLLNKRHLIVE